MAASRGLRQKVIITRQNLDKTRQNLDKTRQNSPKLAKTRQNSPKLAKTRQNSPKLSKTRQNSPKLAKTLDQKTAQSHRRPPSIGVHLITGARNGSRIDDFNNDNGSDKTSLNVSTQEHEPMPRKVDVAQTMDAIVSSIMSITVSIVVVLLCLLIVSSVMVKKASANTDNLQVTQLAYSSQDIHDLRALRRRNVDSLSLQIYAEDHMNFTDTIKSLWSPEIPLLENVSGIVVGVLGNTCHPNSTKNGPIAA
ncbi:hypothetical protein LXG23DRAFT_36087 [Yarrowia lipolytica]|nr:hypothetical protein LXG23DRAFT_36087 [Yarrowia lipolytica]